MEAQLAPVYAILIKDLDGDGQKDIVLGGNLHNVKPEIGRYDANYGIFLKGIKNDFKLLSPQESGLYIDGEIRDLKIIKIENREVLAVIKNNDSAQFFEF